VFAEEVDVARQNGRVTGDDRHVSKRLVELWLQTQLYTNTLPSSSHRCKYARKHSTVQRSVKNYILCRRAAINRYSQRRSVVSNAQIPLVWFLVELFIWDNLQRSETMEFEHQRWRDLRLYAIMVGVVCACVHAWVCVCHKLVLCQNGCTEPDGFCRTRFLNLSYILCKESCINSGISLWTSSQTLDLEIIRVTARASAVTSWPTAAASLSRCITLIYRVMGVMHRVARIHQRQLILHY